MLNNKRNYDLLDFLDRQILIILQTNSRISTENLGNQIGLSATACQRRIKKLRDSGIIHKEVALIDSVSVGSYVTVIVEVILKQGSVKYIDGFRKKMNDNPQVQQCYYVIGENDFILIIIATNMLEYEKLTRQLFFSDENIQKFHSTMVMENVKVGLEIPID